MQERRGQPKVDLQQQREQQLLNAFAANLNKLRRKFESELDPIQDRIDALTALQVSTTKLINETIAERDTLKIEIRMEKEKVKGLEEELEELKKQLEPNIKAEPEPEKKKKKDPPKKD